MASMAGKSPFQQMHLENSWSITPEFTKLLLSAIIFLFILGHITSTQATHRNIPGPVLAGFTDLWRLRVVRSRKSHETYLRLHKKHGDLVRIGSNCISICKPDMIPVIYGIGKGYVKSDFYSVWQNVVQGKSVASMVFTTDEEQHAAMKRPIANAYSLSALKDFEPLIDSTSAVFLSRLDELFATTEKVCDLGTWLQWYAFDVIGELTFSKRLGFLEKAKDVEGICKSVGWNFDRCSVLGQMPWLDLLTYKNPLYLRYFAKPVSNPVIAFGQRRLEERLNEEDAQEDEIDIEDPALKDKVLHGTTPSRPDFLSRFLTLHEEQPNVVTDSRLLAYLFMNINAGSDTIASTLRAVIYYLLKNPSSLSRLTDELQQAQQAGDLTSPLPTWSECQNQPYLTAVIKEALRLNPALALPMERIVPPGPGLIVGHHILPPGTIVGINPWVIHRDPRIFGNHAEEWQPERWLDEDPEKLKYMDSHILSFGAGKRSCLGRNIAMLELTKLIPALVLRYEMTLAEPKKEWNVLNSWCVSIRQGPFHHVAGMWCLRPCPYAPWSKTLANPFIGHCRVVKQEGLNVLLRRRPEMA